MWARKNYVSTVDVANALGMDSSDDGILADINTALSFVEYNVDVFCKTTFNSELNTAKTFEGTGTPMLNTGYYFQTLYSVSQYDTVGNLIQTLTDTVALPRLPKPDLAYTWIERRPASSGLYVFALESFDYFKSANLQDQGEPFLIGYDYVVTADWGFPVIPAQVQQACVYAVQHFFNLRDMNETIKNEFGLNRSIERFKVDSLDTLPNISKMLLGPYVNNRWYAR